MKSGVARDTTPSWNDATDCRSRKINAGSNRALAGDMTGSSTKPTHAAIPIANAATTQD